MGAVNLITPAKRAAAAGLVKSGRAVSLSRPFQPEQHFIRINDRGAAARWWTTTDSCTTASR
jgi:hypothetical protein